MTHQDPFVLVRMSSPLKIARKCLLIIAEYVLQVRFVILRLHGGVIISRETIGRERKIVRERSSRMIYFYFWSVCVFVYLLNCTRRGTKAKKRLASYAR